MTWRRLGLIGASLIIISACNNTYGPPSAGGTPEHYGQQRYIENKAYQELTEDRMNVPD